MIGDIGPGTCQMVLTGYAVNHGNPLSLLSHHWDYNNGPLCLDFKFWRSNLYCNACVTSTLLTDVSPHFCLPLCVASFAHQDQGFGPSNLFSLLLHITHSAYTLLMQEILYLEAITHRSQVEIICETSSLSS